MYVLRICGQFNFVTCDGILQNAECACSTLSLENLTGEGEWHANRLELY